MPKSPRFSPNATRAIEVLTFPAVQLLDVSGPVQVFASANDLVADAGGARPYLLKVVAQDGEGATASAGVTLAAGPLTQAGEALDTLLVAGGEGAEAAAENPVLVDWVRQRRRGRVASPLFAPAHSCSRQRAYWTAAAPRPTGSTGPS
jgi:transcriptional regulator GlxA family with amidase domain